MWWDYLHIEVLCELAAFSRIQREMLDAEIERRTILGHDLDGVILPWSQRPDHARRAHAVRVLGDYHARKRPKTRVCESCGKTYSIPMKRGSVPRKCEGCR
jgi:hypothetical protein